MGRRFAACPLQRRRHPLLSFMTSLRASLISLLWSRGLRKRSCWSHGSAFRLTAWDW